ncbi:MAG: PIN domain-containing protein [Deltaproteobacteria bacterium]|nr:PIN domain-containing protein [Deltaproteobacteria bacterium]
MRLFFDSNVLFTAAHNAKGKAALVIELAAEEGWELITSAFAVVEARRNLELKRPASVGRLDELLEAFHPVVAPQPLTCPVDLPEKDRPILAAAIRNRATHLLTGDLAHFGEFMGQPERAGGVDLCTVAEFLGA